MLNEKAYKNNIAGVWGIFEQEREKLNRQFVNPCYIDGGGLQPDDLRAGFYALKDALANASPVIRKARLFEYLLINARIYIDPNDWFANALDHQNLMSEYNREVLRGISEKYISEANATKKVSHEPYTAMGQR